MRKGVWEPIAAVAALLVLVAVGTWWYLTVLEPPRAPVPGHKGAAFMPLSATMPPIGAFDAFYVNDDNPFVSWREREKERVRLKQPAGVVIRKPPQKETIIKTVEPPKLSLPPAKSGGGDAPKVVGFSRKTDGTLAVIVNLPGENRPRTMKIGEQAGRWTLKAVEDGNVAVFQDETGREYRLIIGAR